MNAGGKALGHLSARRPAVAPVARETKHTVTLIPGDGIGEDVADAVVKIVEATGVSLGWDRHLSGQKALARFGTPLPPQLIDSVRKHKVALKGRISTPLGPGLPGPACESPNVAMRKALDLFASVRPVRNLPGLKSRYEDVDFVVIRECTEDVYAGIEHEVVPGVVESLKVVTALGSERIARFAFDYAREHGRKTVTCVHKANIMKRSDGLFLERFRAVAGECVGVASAEMLADACMMQLVLDPRRFDVLVMGNLLGDIVSDLGAGLVGGLGTVPGINRGDGIVVFEAIHGNAPHLEGQDLANPLPLLLPAVEMLKHLGEDEAARRIMRGIRLVLEAGQALTPDLGGRARTSEMAQAIIDAMVE